MREGEREKKIADGLNDRPELAAGRIRLPSSLARSLARSPHSDGRGRLRLPRHGATRATAIIVVAVVEESRRIRENYRTPRKYIVGLSGWLGRSCIEADYR